MTQKKKFSLFILAICLLSFSVHALPATSLGSINSEQTAIEKNSSLRSGDLLTTTDGGKTITGLTEAGKTHFQNNHLLKLPAGITKIEPNALKNLNLETVDFSDVSDLEIGDYAFMNNKFTALNLQNVKKIGKGAFQSNSIETVELATVKEVGDNAFKANSISEINVPEGISSWGNNVFDSNKQFVKITTTSTLPALKTGVKAYGSYGEVINPIVVTISYINNETQQALISDEMLGDDFSTNQFFFEGTKFTFGTKKISGYKANKAKVGATEIPTTGDNQFEIIIPTGAEKKISVFYEKIENPSITIAVDKKTNFAQGVTVNEEELLKGITAEDANGKDITSQLTVTPKTVDTSAEGSKSEVTYSVTDSYGNTATKKVTITVAVDLNALPIGEGWTLGDFTYNGNSVTGFRELGKAKYAKGNNLTLVIPHINPNTGEEINKIGNKAFLAMSKITAVKLDRDIYPINLKEIGEQAFEKSGCITVTIPEGVTSVGEDAFFKNKLTSITLPSTLKTIGKSAFRQNELTSVTIPESVTTIEAQAFMENNLTKANIPDGITSIAASAFFINQLTEVKIPKGVTNIGSHAFSKNQLTSVDIPEGVTTIGEDAFFKNKLTSLSLPSTLKIIGKSAFRKNELTSVDIPDGVTTIESHAFMENKLTKVRIPEGIKTIAGSTFYINELTEVKIPNSVTSIGGHAFRQNALTSVIIPEGVTSIDEFTFYDNKLTSVTLPKNLKTIGTEAFSSNEKAKNYNNKLTKISLPDSLISIGRLAFRYNNLESVILPEGLESIGNAAFSENRLKSIILPDNVTNIGIWAFNDNQITTIKISKNIKDISNYAFFGNKITSVDIPEGVTRIGDGAFQKNQLTSVDIPEGVTSIGQEAFFNNLLTEINIPASLKTIHNTAFQRNPGKENKLVFLYTPDGKNDGISVVQGVGHIVNPLIVTVKYEDEAGNSIAPNKTIVTTPQEAFEIEPINIFGYKTPDKKTEKLTENTTVTLTYTKENLSGISKDGLLSQVYYFPADATNGASKAEIAKEMYTRIVLNTTGITKNIKGGKIVLYYEEEFIDETAFEIKMPEGMMSGKPQIEKGKITITLQSPITVGTEFTAPIVWKYKKNVTPQGHKSSVNAVLLAIEEGEEKTLAITSPLYLEGYYNTPTLTKYVFGSPHNGDPIDVGSFKEGQNVNYVSEGEEKDLVYSYTLTGLGRYAESFTLTEVLPTYKAWENGAEVEKTAFFDPEKNSGWTLSADGKSVSYTQHLGAFGTNNFNDKLPKLILSYPGAKYNENVGGKAEISIVPLRKPESEPVITTSDKISNLFVGHLIPNDGIIDVTKRSYKPNYDEQKREGFLLNIDREKRANYYWTISLNVNSKHTESAKNIVLEDYDLDSQMLYVGIVFPENIDGVKAELYNGDNKIDEISLVKGENLFDESKLSNITKVKIVFPSSFEIMPGDSFVLDFISKLKDPTLPLENGTIFKNHSKFIVGNIGAASGSGTIYVKDGRLESYIRIARTDNLNYYELGQKPEYQLSVKAHGNQYKEKEPLKDFKYAFVLPQGIIVEEVLLKDNYINAKNPSYSIKEDYKDTGRVAVVFSADEIAGGDFVLANVKTRISSAMQNPMPEDGQLLTEAYATWSNETVKKIYNKKDEFGFVEKDKTLPYSSDWLKVIAPTGLFVEKFIRKDATEPWAKKTSTEPLGTYQYKLKITNASKDKIVEAAIYDVLPFVGDQFLDQKVSRGSKFRPTLESVEGSYTIGYYNGEDDFTFAPSEEDVYGKLMGLTWSPAKTETTKAIKVAIGDIEKGGFVEVIVNMKSPVLNDVYNPTDAAVNTHALVFKYQKENGNQSAEMKMEGDDVFHTLVPKVNIRIHKVEKFRNDDNTTTEINFPGVNFTLKNTKGTVSKKLATDENGNITFTDLFIDDYILTEATPEGFHSITPIQISKESLLTWYQANKTNNAALGTGFPVKKIINHKLPTKANFTFTKIDKYAKEFPGIVFKIEGIDTHNKGVIQTQSSDISGNVNFKGLLVGRYKVSEIASQGLLKLIPPFEIEILESYDKKTYTPESVDGYIASAVPNKVSLKEVTAELTLEKLKNDRGAVKLYKLGMLSLDDKEYKDLRSVDGSLLEGVEFSLIQDGNGVSYTIAKSGDGVLLDNLILDVVYEIKETKAPEGYELPKTAPEEEYSIKFQISGKGELLTENGAPFAGKEIYFPNIKTKKPSTISITKRDATDKNVVLAGAEFTLYKRNNDGTESEVEASAEQANPQTTNTDGKAEFKNLYAGTYIVKETKAPKGYFMNFAPQTVVLGDYEGKTVKVDAKDLKADFNLRKVSYVGRDLSRQAAEALVETILVGDKPIVEKNANGLYNVLYLVAGAEFNLKGEGLNITGIVSEAGGMLNLSNDDKDIIVSNPDKTYVLTETAAPEGYNKPSAAKSFKLADYTKLAGFDGKVTIDMHNPRKLGRIVVTKYSDQKTVLPGAEFTLYIDAVNESNKIKTESSDATGLAIFSNLPYGKYIVKETKAPTGYFLNDTEYVANVGEGEDNAMLDHSFIVNNISYTNLTVEKKWVNIESQTTLPTVKIQLMKKVGAAEPTTEGEIVTLSEDASSEESNWKHSFKNLPNTLDDGTGIFYSVVETMEGETKGKYKTEYSEIANGVITITNTYDENSTGIHLVKSKSKISLYPNPVINMLYISSDSKIKRLELFDVLGKLQLTKEITHESELKVDLSSLKTGVYYLRVIEEASFSTLKLIKR